MGPGAEERRNLPRNFLPFSVYGGRLIQILGNRKPSPKQPSSEFFRLTKLTVLSPAAPDTKVNLANMQAVPVCVHALLPRA